MNGESPLLYYRYLWWYAKIKEGRDASRTFLFGSDFNENFQKDSPESRDHKSIGFFENGPAVQNLDRHASRRRGSTFDKRDGK